jgi:uncharacterized membrane protein
MSWRFGAMLFGLGAFFALTGTVAAQEDFVIDSFNSQIELRQDGKAVVEETIAVDFRLNSKHGIFREIPETFLDRNNNRLKTTISPISVTDEFGTPYQYEQSRSSRLMRLKIGDPNQTITGAHTYVLSYEIEDVINFFDTHDEFYWNVTGNEWPVPIGSTTVQITAPSMPVDTICYTGYTGSRTSGCTTDTADEVVIAKADGLSAGEGLTMAVSYPAGSFHRPSTTEQVWKVLKHNWGYFIPVISLLGLFGLYWQEGRDRYYVSHFAKTDEARLPLFAPRILKDTYYPPKEVTAAEAGVIVDETVHNQDIAAILISLANKGAITITDEGKKKYRFNRTGKSVALKRYEQEFMDGMFGSADEVKLSDLKYSFTTTANKVRQQLYSTLTDEKYFVARPDRVRTLYAICGIALIFLGFKLMAAGQMMIWGISVGIGVMISGVLVLLFTRSMPRRTAKGRRVLEEVLGLKRVIELGAYRQEIFEKHNYFTEILPFAIAFGLTKQWAKAVEQLSIPKPEWYNGQGHFSSSDFSRSMNDLSKTSASTLTAVKSSASSGRSGFSGGSSGGGFGGGGGGSW